VEMVLPSVNGQAENSRGAWRLVLWNQVSPGNTGNTSGDSKCIVDCMEDFT